MGSINVIVEQEVRLAISCHRFLCEKGAVVSMLICIIHMASINVIVDQEVRLTVSCHRFLGERDAM
jgi:hypothetical protein